MSKIYKLREWLTVPEAAKQLSISFGEEVTEADVLRLGLDGRLRLSVYFVNFAKARCGRVVSWEDTDWLLVPDSLALPGGRTLIRSLRDTLGPNPKVKNPVSESSVLIRSLPDTVPEARPLPPKAQALFDELPPDECEKFYPLMLSLNIDGERFLTLSDNVTTLRGVWDLTMLGSERLDVEHAFQNLTDGPAVTLVNIEGTFVEWPDGTICQLQEDFDDNEHQPGSLAALEKLKRRIAVDAIPPAKAEALLKRHAEQRKAFLERRKECSAKERYFPASGLPEDAVLVVRTEALREFEQSINGAPVPKVNAYSSGKLATLNQAAAKYWANADRDDRGTHEDNATVAAWLVQQGFSPTLAAKAATIIRPEWAPTGRKPEE
jgi:hypothetical protein